MVWLTETIKEAAGSRIFSIHRGEAILTYSINDGGLPT